MVGKVVVITGASSGIGRELATQLAARGARLALAARNEETLEQTRQECAAAGAEAIVVATDVADMESCRRLMQTTVDRFGRLDVLINNAGISMYAPFVQITYLSLFERVMERLTAGPLESQRLLVPLILEVAASAHNALVARARELERFGFEIESFGAAVVKVTAVPALLGTEDCAKALAALAEDLEGLDRGAHVQEALQRIAATTACHAAVKANYPLTYEKMTHILDELRATAYSTVCPHGRPVMLRLKRREIEKNFDRI